LKPRRGSCYRQLFVEGRIKAEILYRATIGREPLTPAEVARDYGIPVEAVFEAIDYCQRHSDVLDPDRAMEEASIQAHSLNRWPYAPNEIAVER
jgi:hypothetical protein